MEYTVSTIYNIDEWCKGRCEWILVWYMEWHQRCFLYKSSNGRPWTCYSHDIFWKRTPTSMWHLKYMWSNIDTSNEPWIWLFKRVWKSCRFLTTGVALWTGTWSVKYFFYVFIDTVTWTDAGLMSIERTLEKFETKRFAEPALNISYL